MGQLNYACTQRIQVKGKFLFCGKEKFYIKGVTYGNFAPDVNGCQFPEPSVVEKKRL